MSARKIICDVCSLVTVYGLLVVAACATGAWAKPARQTSLTKPSGAHYHVVHCILASTIESPRSARLKRLVGRHVYGQVRRIE
jgi:hypothetical protein